MLNYSVTGDWERSCLCSSVARWVRISLRKHVYTAQLKKQSDNNNYVELFNCANLHHCKTNSALMWS